jgi:uncharacterized membrane protein YphA (DoxX/SURF4 family)
MLLLLVFVRFRWGLSVAGELGLCILLLVGIVAQTCAQTLAVIEGD